jgi:hypothetical protein
MHTANIVAATMDIVIMIRIMIIRRMEIVLVIIVILLRLGGIVDQERIIVRRVPTHRSATLERTVHLEVERTVGEIRPVSSVLLESSRQ